MTEVRSEAKRVATQRLKDGWQCVECGARTSAVNDVGEAQCTRCQRRLRKVTAQATATCACGEEMLSEAEWCGFCSAELAQERVELADLHRGMRGWSR